MKIGIMSDTHGSLLYLEKALDILHECDVILHGGDVLYHGPRNDIPKGYNPKEFISKLNEVGNIIIAKGNCDSDVDQMVINHPIQSPYVMSQFGETRILLTHGYTESKDEIIKKAKNMGAAHMRSTRFFFAHGDFEGGKPCGFLQILLKFRYFKSGCRFPNRNGELQCFRALHFIPKAGVSIWPHH